MTNEREVKRVLTPEEVALELNVSRNLIYRQLRRGEIPHVKVGDLYLISRVAFDEWLNGLQTSKFENTNKPASVPYQK
jgi:excisionase family DNA binding protein